MTDQDEYANLPPVIADALERAEARYRDSFNAANAYQHLPVLASGRVLGAEFIVYENADPGSLPEEFAKSPVLLHSTNARFRSLCLFISRHWLSDFDGA